MITVCDSLIGNFGAKFSLAALVILPSHNSRLKLLPAKCLIDMLLSVPSYVRICTNFQVSECGGIVNITLIFELTKKIENTKN